MAENLVEQARAELARRQAVAAAQAEMQRRQAAVAPAPAQDPMLPSPDTDTRSTQEYLRDTGQAQPIVDVRGYIERQAEPRQQRDLGRLGDLAASGISGFSRGVGALASTPAIIGELLDAGYERIGLTPKGSAERNRQSNPLSSQNIQSAIGETLLSGVGGYQPQTTAGEYASTIGEFAPGGLAARAPAMMGTVIPAVGSEAAGQITEGTAAEPYARIAGALMAPMAAQGLQRTISPMSGALDPARQQSVSTLRQAGVQPTAGQVAGPSAGQNQLYREASTATGRGLADQAQEQFTTAALRSIGENAPRATADVLQNATQRIGSVFDDAIQGVNIVPSQANATRLRAVVDQAQDLTATGLPRLFERIGDQVDDALRSGQAVRPEVARNWRSNLSALTKNSDSGVRSAAIDALEVVDDIIENSLTAAGRPQAVQALSDARRQYRNLLAIERAAARAEDGLLSPQALRTALLGQSRRQYTQGQGDLAPLTRAANEVLERLPNSGTSQRTLAQQLTGNAQAGTGAGLGSFGLGLDPVAATGVGLAATAAPALRNQLMSSPIGQRYFLNQLIPQANVTPRMLAGMLTGTAAQ